MKATDMGTYIQVVEGIKPCFLVSISSFITVGVVHIFNFYAFNPFIHENAKSKIDNFSKIANWVKFKKTKQQRS